MTFRLTSDHVHQYHTQGYTVLRQVIPLTLLGACGASRKGVGAGAAKAADPKRNACSRGQVRHFGPAGVLCPIMPTCPICWRPWPRLLGYPAQIGSAEILGILFEPGHTGRGRLRGTAILDRYSGVSILKCSATCAPIFAISIRSIAPV